MPSACAAARALALSPLRRIAAPDGPTNAMPASAQAADSSERSETKPYPGCSPSQPVSFAAATTRSMSR